MYMYNTFLCALAWMFICGFNHFSVSGLTPLCVSVLNNYTDIALRLLSHNADCVNVCDRRNNLPLHYAVRNGNTQLVTALLAAGESLQSL